MRHAERIAQSIGVDVDRGAAAHRRPATLELVDGEVNAGAAKRPQRPFDTLVVHQAREIFLLAACVPEQRPVGTVRLLEDRPAGEFEERAHATGEPPRHNCTAFGYRQRVPQIGRQPAEHPRGHADIIPELPV